MPDTQLNIAVEKIVEALEQMTFMTTLPYDGVPHAPDRPLLVEIEFDGPVAGRMQVMAGEALGTALAANIFGTDPSDPQAAVQSRDALKEMLNVCCGSVLADWPDRAPGVCRMGIPEARDLSAEKWGQLLAGNGFSCLDVEGNPIAIRLLEKTGA